MKSGREGGGKERFRGRKRVVFQLVSFYILLNLKYQSDFNSFFCRRKKAKRLSKKKRQTSPLEKCPDSFTLHWIVFLQERRTWA